MIENLECSCNVIFLEFEIIFIMLYLLGFKMIEYIVFLIVFEYYDLL